MEAETTTATGWKSRPFYTRVAIVGLLVEAVFLLVLGILVLTTDDPSIIVVLAIFFVPSFLIAGLMWQFARWAVVVGAVWALLSTLAAIAFMAPGLFFPSSFFDFGLGLPIVVSAIVALVAAITANIQYRRGTIAASSGKGARRTFATLTIVVVALMALSAVLHVSSLSTVSAEDKVGALEVEIKDFDFSPTALTASAGQGATVVVKNNDFPVHTFTIEELDISVTVVSGAEKLVELPALTAGTYQYTCEVEGHQDMTGTLTVQ